MKGNFKDNMERKRILFVCMGNICRSPAAEAIMKKLIADKNLTGQVEVDSAGTIDDHCGESADSRMIEFAESKGYKINSIARQFDSTIDFPKFDYIVTMDDENFDDISSMDIQNKYHNKIFRMVDFCKTHKINEIPDPYYSRQAGFDQVLELLEDATEGLLNRVINDIKQFDQDKT